MACAKLTHKISIHILLGYEGGLAPGKTEAFTVIQKGFGPFCFKLTILLGEVLKMHENIVGRADLIARMTFIKHEKKDKF